MGAVTGPALVAAALLALAGAQKLLDPSMTAGALRAMGLPGSPALVRLGAAAELALGVGAVVSGGAALWGLVAASYLAFAVFVVAALRRGTMIGTCGCFGREDTPPSRTHVALNLVFAAVAFWATTSEVAPLSEIADHPGAGVVVVTLSAGALALTYLAFTLLPRARSGAVEPAGPASR